MTALLNAIETDFVKIHGRNTVSEQQITTRQIHTLNKIQDLFSTGASLLVFVNAKTNNESLFKLQHNTVLLTQIVDLINNSKLSDILQIISAAGKRNHPAHKVHTKKSMGKNVSKNSKNTIITYK